MNAQPTLFDAPADPIRERWEAFKRANPRVLPELIRLARQARRRGFDRWSINAAFELLRWEWAARTEGDEFKLNNDFRACAARDIMAECPDLDGLFETRERTAA